MARSKRKPVWMSPEVWESRQRLNSTRVGMIILVLVTAVILAWTFWTGHSA